MTITVKEDLRQEVHKHRRRIEFEGAEPQKHYAYSHRDKLFIPEVASTSWNHGGQPTSIHVRGPVVKKDGTPSTLQVDFSYRTPANRDWGRQQFFKDGPDAPAWLLELFGIEDVPTEDMGQ